MNIFLGSHSLPNLNQEIENLIIPILVIKIFNKNNLTKKISDQDKFTNDEFCEALKED